MACFAILRDNVPSWISDVNELSVHVHNKRAEFAAEAAKASALTSRRRKSMSSSLSSNRSGKSLLEEPSPAPAASASHRLKRFLSRDSLRADACRKRKVASPQSDVSGNEQPATTADSEITTSPPERKKPTHIISYDGHTQKALEKMVRDIWTVKSSIRSSRIQNSMRTAFGDRMKMQFSVQKYSNDKTGGVIEDTADKEPAPIEVDDENADTEDPLELRMLLMKQRHRQYLSSSRLQPQPMPTPSQQRRPKQDPYDFIEAQLDSVQTLCETAAYRFLRFGNCLEELESILRAYEFILEASTCMAEKKEREQARAEAEAQTAQAEAAEEQGKKDTAIEVDDDETAIDATAAVAAAATQNKGVGMDDSKGDILEVDDRSDASEVSIDITAFRITRYGQRTMQTFRVNRA